MARQFFFVYGTLMTEHPEHDRFCPSPLSVADAYVQGELFQLPEGYPLLKIDSGQILGHATLQPRTDWDQASCRAAPPPFAESGASIVHGQLLEYDPPEEVIRTMDQWEGFAPGQDSIYQRYLARAFSAETTDAQLCWLYACLHAPPKARPLKRSNWLRPEWLSFE